MKLSLNPVNPTPPARRPGCVSANANRPLARDVSVQRVAHGHGVGFAIVADGVWVGTLAGTDGHALWHVLGTLPDALHGELLRGVALGMISAGAHHIRDDLPPEAAP
jgi:hypothetical protein